jgi:hypothetical protein
MSSARGGEPGGSPHTPSDDDALVEVRLLAYPLKAGVRATQHYNDVFREFALLAADESLEAHAVPHRLLALIDALGRRYARQDEHEAERDAAFARGETTRDFTFTIPVSAGEASAVLDRMLDETDEFCRDGTLLTLAAPPDVVAFRRWYLREVQRQSLGREPTPWSDGKS